MEAQSGSCHLKIKRLATVVSDCLVHALTRPFFDKCDDASAASGTADLGGSRSLLPGRRNQLIDERGRDARER